MHCVKLHPYMGIPKRHLSLNVFLCISSITTFHCEMCHRRSRNHTINHLLERYLRIIYSYKNYTLEDLLDNDDSISIHKRNLHFVAMEIFKVAKNSAPTIFYEIFQKHIRNTT